jgi:hypothetical protein
LLGRLNQEDKMTGHVTRMAEREMFKTFSLKNLSRIEQSGELGVDWIMGPNIKINI